MSVKAHNPLFLFLILNSLFLKPHTSDDPYGDRDTVNFPGYPVRHYTEYSDGLLVEQVIHAPQKANIAYAAVGIYDKPTGNPALYPFVVSLLRIATIGIDEFCKFGVPSGE